MVRSRRVCAAALLNGVQSKITDDRGTGAVTMMWLLGAVVDDAKQTSPEEPARQPAGRHADQELARKLAGGDAGALAELYDTHIRAVYSLVIRIVNDQAEAEDIVQDVFSQAWAQAARYEAHRASVGGWLLMMTRSRAIDRLRAGGARPDAALANDAATVRLPDPARGQDFPVQSNEEAARLRMALAELPLLQRVAIELAYFEGLSQSQIAERLEQPLGTVKTRIRSGLMKLRVALEDIS